MITQTQASASGDKKFIESVAKEVKFPWDKVEGDDSTPQHLTEDDDFSFIETGDLGAAEKNAGKNFNLF